jgi:hypothetical protein
LSVKLPPLRAPRRHGEILAVPPLEDVGPLLETQQRRFRASPLQLLGHPLSELRELARQEAITACARYHHEAGEPDDIKNHDRWIMAGHQPELFHPGVWYKNFVLHDLARRHHATAINLVVDNDTAKSTLLKVPVNGRLHSLPFDTWQSETPFEERTVQDEALFASTPARFAEMTRNWPFQPLLADVWRFMGDTPLLGERFVRARRALERRWGSHPCEVPLSRLCQGQAFGWFVGHLLANLPALHAQYNQSVHEYRAAHGIRSRNHPVPDLASDGGWLEAPFWAWRAGASRRRRLFVREQAGTLELRAGDDPWPALPIQDFADHWPSLQQQGCKLRTRALTTTLFVRLLLADLFVHGIGGGKYDELADTLIQRFFGIEPPRYLVLSATLLLPIPRTQADASTLQKLQLRQRELIFNPQRHLPEPDESAMALMREKSVLIAQTPAHGPDAKNRFRRLHQINEQLGAPLAGLRSETAQAIVACQAEVERNAAANRRDYAFCLYPEAMLRDFFGQQAAKV